ncbi:MAG: hypothetical protein JWM47_450, partial [Acidimicrobiales bacterium]|nr:hypothetical protein [Acidimicrobiales bacterium]
AAVLLGVAAVVAVANDAPAWPPHVDLHGVATGAAVAVAAFAVALIGAAAAGGARWSGGWVRPRLRRPDPRHSAAPSRPR